jgi:hypothetical protein
VGHHDVVSAANATHLQGGHEAAPPLVGREAVGQSQAGLQAVPLRAARGAGLKAELLWWKKAGNVRLASRPNSHDNVDGV